MALWEQVKENLVEWYETATDRTQELSRIGVRAYDKFGIRRDIERQFTELGGIVFEALEEGRSDLQADETVAAIVGRIHELQKELKLKQEEIDDIKEEHRRRAAARTDTEPGWTPPASPEEPQAAAGDVTGTGPERPQTAADGDSVKDGNPDNNG